MRQLFMCAVVCIVGCVSFNVYAQDEHQIVEQELMCPHLMMMRGQCMMKPKLVATEDGGVVVLIGTTIIKYDKDLTLQKKVELPVEVESKKEKIQDKKECLRKKSQ